MEPVERSSPLQSSAAPSLEKRHELFVETRSDTFGVGISGIGSKMMGDGINSSWIERDSESVYSGIGVV